MKKEGNRLKSDALKISNNIIDTLVESNNIFNDKVIQDVRDKIETVLLFNTDPDIVKVINSDITLFNLVIRAFKKYVKSEVFDLLNYDGISYHELKYHDVYKKQTEKSNKDEILDDNQKENSISHNLLNTVILPIRDGVKRINSNVETFIKNKFFTFDTVRYTKVFKDGFIKIKSIISILGEKEIKEKDVANYTRVVQNAESDIVKVAKDPFHRAIKYTYNFLSSKKHYSNYIPEDFYKNNTADSLKKGLIKTENTSKALSNYMRNFLRHSGYLNLEQDLADSQKII